MKTAGYEEALSAASETYMPRLEVAARLVSAVIVAAFMWWLPSPPLLLSLPLVFASIGAYAAFSAAAGYIVLRGRASSGLIHLALWVDIIAGAALLLNDPFEVPPTIVFLLLAVLGNGLQHGRRLFMQGLVGVSVTLAAALLLRQGLLLGAFPYPLAFLLLPLVLGTYYFYVVITRIEALKQHAELRSEEDPLTRLPNRRAFRRAAAYLLQLSHRTGTPLVVMYADFDNFKMVNDRHGHAMGDKALCQFADIIRRNIRGADLAARLGGDEFVFMLTNTRAGEAEPVAERLRLEFLDWLAQQELPGGVSFGISEVPPHNADLDKVLRQVDVALYRAKAHTADSAIVLAEC